MGRATLIIEVCAMIGMPETPRPPTVPTSAYRTFSQTMSSPAEALEQVYSRYVGALQGASDFLRDDLPSASPGVAKWAQETGRRACRKYARQRGSIPFLTSDPSWDGICSGYWEAINEGPTSGGGYEPPFSGGQCEGTIYQVIVTLTQGTDVPGGCDPPFDISVNGEFGVPGPIRGLSLGSAVIPGANLPGKSAALNYGQNQQISLGTTFGGCNTPFAVIKSITRLSGNPDTCGDPPPEYRPPTFPPNLPPLSPPTNPAPGLGNNWDVNILPDGNLEICIGGECSTGTPPGGGGGPDSGGGPGEPDGDPQETDPSDPNDPNEVSGCVEDGNILTGVKIEVTEAPPNYQGLGDIYYKSCWVWMGPGSDLLDMVIDGRTLESGQFVIPDSNDCTCYKVRANPGFKVSVQAYSRPKEE